MTTLTIGAVARAAGVGIDTIRYYEREGFLAPPPRTPSGYRTYPPDAVTTVRFIKHAQRLGFTLAEIGELRGLQETTKPCEAVKERATGKVLAIEEKVAALKAMQVDLLALIARCDAVCATECTVLSDLGAPAADDGGVPAENGFRSAART